MCNGSKIQRSEDQIGNAYVNPCGHCAGKGKPTNEDKAKAEREDKGLCIECEMPMHDHPGQGFPYGCLRLLLHRVKTLEEGRAQDQEVVKEANRDIERIQRDVSALENAAKDT